MIWRMRLDKKKTRRKKKQRNEEMPAFLFIGNKSALKFADLIFDE